MSTPYDRLIKSIHEDISNLEHYDKRQRNILEEHVRVVGLIHRIHFSLKTRLKELQDEIQHLFTRDQANNLGVKIDWDKSSILAIENIVDTVEPQEPQGQEPQEPIVDTTPDTPSNKS